MITDNATLIRAVQLKQARDVKPGDITTDGLVAVVTLQDNGLVAIEHRNTIYLEKETDTVAVFGKVSAEILKATLDSLKEEGKLS